MQTKMKIGLGWFATGILLLPLGAAAHTQQTQQTTVEGHADSDRWVGTQTTTRVTTPSTRSNASRDDVQTSGDLARSESARASGAQGRVQNVNARFEERVGDNCQYRGTVRGTVREVNVRGATADNARQVTPDLRIQAELSCQNGSARRTVNTTLRGPQYAREQLAQAIQERARIYTTREGQVCSYAPSLSFDGGRVASNGVARSCTIARGGGPNGTMENDISPLLRTPTGAAVDTQRNQGGSMMQAPARNDLLNDNGMQQMPSTGGGPGLPGSDVQQGQPSIDDTMNRNTQQQPMDTTGTGQDIAPDSMRSNPPIRQMK